MDDMEDFGDEGGVSNQHIDQIAVNILLLTLKSSIMIHWISFLLSF